MGWRCGGRSGGGGERDWAGSRVIFRFRRLVGVDSVLIWRDVGGADEDLVCVRHHSSRLARIF